MNSSVVSFRVSALTIDELRHVAPSVFAENAQPTVSSRYTFVSTAAVVTMLQDAGWEPVRASEQRVRLEERRGFQLHEVRFARRADLESGNCEVGNVRPEMILHNAHDGTRAYRIAAGLFRLVCRNGLVVNDANFAHASIRHADASPERFTEAARAIADGTPRVLEVVAAWQRVTLSPAARAEFARRAVALRWAESGPVGQTLQPEKVLEPVRYGDSATDLWTTYNLVQERVLRGGMRYIATSFGRFLQPRKTRAVTSIQAAHALNKDLWSLASEFAHN